MTRSEWIAYLRKPVAPINGPNGEPYDCALEVANEERAEAADEIERLTALRDAAEANATHWHTQCMQAREMAAAWEREARNLKEASSASGEAGK